MSQTLDREREIAEEGAPLAGRYLSNRTHHVVAIVKVSPVTAHRLFRQRPCLSLGVWGGAPCSAVLARHTPWQGVRLIQRAGVSFPFVLEYKMPRRCDRSCAGNRREAVRSFEHVLHSRHEKQVF